MSQHKKYEVEEVLSVLAEQKPLLNSQLQREIMSNLEKKSVGKSGGSSKRIWYKNWRLYVGGVAACFVIFTTASLAQNVWQESQGENNDEVMQSSVASKEVMTIYDEGDMSFDRGEMMEKSEDSAMFEEQLSSIAPSFLPPVEGDDFDPSVSGQRVIKNATYVLEVGDPGSKAQIIIDLTTNNFQGFVQDSSVSQSSSQYDEDSRYRYENARLVLRVPTEKFDEYRKMLQEMDDATVISEHLSGQDVSKEYVDIEARRRNLVVEEEQLQILMSRAGTIDEILKVRIQLVDIRSEIERLTAQLERFDNQIAYSTFVITLQAPGGGVVEPVEDKWDIKVVWDEAWQGVIEDYQSLAEISLKALVSLTLYLPMAILSGLILWWVWKSIKKTSSTKVKK